MFVPYLAQFLTGRDVARRMQHGRTVVAGASAHHAWPLVRHGVQPDAVWVATTVAGEYSWHSGHPERPLSRSKVAVLSRLFSAMEERVLRSSRNVFVTSDATAADVWRQYRIDATVLPVPVDLERFRPALGGGGVAASKSQGLRALFLGRPNDARKGFDLAYATLRVLQRSGPAELRVVSDNSDLIKLPSGCSRLSVADDRELVEQFHASDVLLMPSHQEGFGLAAVEALASGLAVVATPFGGAEPLLRTLPTCEVVDTRTPDVLARAALSLVRQEEWIRDGQRTRSLICEYFEGHPKPDDLFR